MSKEALTKVVQRAISDAAFRRQLASDASGALRGYDLTADEIGAMRTRDAAKLTAFGVDVRMSKVFALDPGTTGAATLTSGSEPRDVAPVWIGDGSEVQSVHTYSGDDNAGPQVELPSGSEPRDIAPVWIGDGSVSSDGYATDEGQLTNDSQGADIHIASGDGNLQQ